MVLLFSLIDVVYAAEDSVLNTPNASQTILAGIYKHTYEYNSEDNTEDHYIVVSDSNSVLNIQYYGTSDDFDSGREGYLPGFYSVAAKNIEVESGSISFAVMPTGFFDKPIIPNKTVNKTANKVSKGAINPSAWSLLSHWQMQQFSGTYQLNKIVLDLGRSESRVFERIQ